MAFLMLLCQKMRLQRKQNQLTLKQMRYSSLVERGQKKVDKREKYYAKLEKQLERQANYYKNSANMYFSQMAGLGTNSVNLGNIYGSNGATMAALQSMSASQMQEILSKSGIDIDLSGNSKIVDILKNGGITKATYDDPNGKFKSGDIIDLNGKPADLGGVSPEAVYNASSKLQQIAQMQVSQMQQYTTQMKTNYEQNVSIWLEAQQEQLEAQKEWEMDMLAEEQADLEAEKTSVETQLELIKQEKQNIEQMLGQAIQDSAPKFGLA